MVLLLEYNIFVLFPPLLTIVSATGAGGHCKGKRELFIAEGKKTEMCGAVLQAEAASSLRLRL